MQKVSTATFTTIIYYINHILYVFNHFISLAMISSLSCRGVNFPERALGLAGGLHSYTGVSLSGPRPNIGSCGLRKGLLKYLNSWLYVLGLF